MSDDISLQLENRDDERLKGACASRILQTFGFNGHVNYAFIYGTWEIIRARKVGTTHTKVDYVVYRLFYPVILIGVSLFGVIAETSLDKYFCMLEVWNMILHISYAFIFLQNVLTNNLHREPVKGRQKIPERLIVTDEIEKGGHKFYICKRYSILPNDSLYHTERLIWFMFNIIASVNISLWLVHSSQQFESSVLKFKVIGRIGRFILASSIFDHSIMIRFLLDHGSSMEHQKATTKVLALFAILDVFLTPIPMRLMHVIYPLCYSLIYAVFSYLMFKMKDDFVLYKQLDWEKKPKQAINAVGYGMFVVLVVHFIIVGFSTLRDYVVSILDDSKTPKQLQNLRSQKRLARRKLMNVIEGPDGRVLEITLEKHAHAPTADVFIKKVKDNTPAEAVGGDSTTTSEDEENQNDQANQTEPGQAENDVIPLSVPIKPPPPLRYSTPTKPGTVYSSSSSNEDINDLEAIKDVTLPQPPSLNIRKDNHTTIRSRIPIPLRKLGLHPKPRDSKEAIQHKLSIDRIRGDTPPTPPFIRLVQTMIQQKKEKKQVGTGLESQSKKKTREPSGEPLGKGVASVKLVGAKEETKARHKESKKTKRSSSSGSENLQDLSETSSLDSVVLTKGKPIAAAVINTPAHVKQWKEQNKDIFEDFHSKLIHKLQKEQVKGLGVGDTPDSGLQGRKSNDPEQKEEEVSAQPKKVKRKKKKLNNKGILKPAEGERLENHEKKRRTKLIKRRTERMFLVRQGHPVYHPLETPNIKQATTFHYLGTKLKGEKAVKKVLNQQELQAYREHPGIAPSDDIQVSGPQSIVSFHPVVRYFEVNEAKGDDKKHKGKKIK